MKNTLEDIRKNIQNNEYQNKEHIRLSLISRILDKLGWDLWNPYEVYPDFTITLNKSKFIIDLALFVSPPTPSVFIHIMSIEKFEQNIKEYKRLLNDYIGSSTSLFSILTNGKHWKFYYFQSDEKIFNECFLTLNMIENNIDELESSFEMYLSKTKIADGSAQRDVKKHLWQSILSQVVTEVLPKAQLLVNKPPYPRLPEAVVQLITMQGLKITEDEAVELLEKIKKPEISSESSTDTPEDNKSVTNTQVPGYKPVKSDEK